MRDVILRALADKWDIDARSPGNEDGSDEAKIPNAIRKGQREAKRECAETLRTLLSIIGEEVIA